MLPESNVLRQAPPCIPDSRALIEEEEEYDHRRREEGEDEFPLRHVGGIVKNNRSSAVYGVYEEYHGDGQVSLRVCAQAVF